MGGGARGSARAGDGDVADHRRAAGLRLPSRDELAHAYLGGIVGDHDLVEMRVEILPHERAEAALQQVRAPIGGNDDGDADAHRFWRR